MFQEIANLSRGALNCTMHDIVANLRVTTGSCLKGERRIDGWSKHVPRLTDTREARLQVRMGIGDCGG